jgi:hypothetical protein
MLTLWGLCLNYSHIALCSSSEFISWHQVILFCVKCRMVDLAIPRTTVRYLYIDLKTVPPPPSK